LLAAGGLLVIAALPLVTGPAAGQESLSDLQSRMDELQSELNEAQATIEELRTQEDELRQRLAEIDVRTDGLIAKKTRLEGRVVRAANILYKSGKTEMFEALLTSESIAELELRAEVLSQLSQRDNAAFIAYARTQDELDALTQELRDKEDRLADTRSSLASETERLQTMFDEVASEYDDLKKKLAAQAAAAREQARQEAAAVAAAAPAVTSQPVDVPRPSGDMTCPVAGPHSFVDSWGAPRSGGRTHEGTDLMAGYGTPVVAIVSGNITYAGYGDSAGNWLILSGDDGNGYWYMHNQENLVGGGRVSVGQQIATVGDTGNATGIPHLHFEYHPGGGGPVNPYPLLVQIC
jgi:murein DD-endopeptidase MepM/ murein hydrolase activator NlpD